MNEEELRLFIRQAFQLERVAIQAVENVDPFFGQALARIKRLVENLGGVSSLSRELDWNFLRPLVLQELAPYSAELGKSLIDQLSMAAPEMQQTAEEIIDSLKLPINRVTSQNVIGLVDDRFIIPDTVIDQVNRVSVNNARLNQLFGLGPPGSQFVQSSGRVVDRIVRRGIISQQSTRDIADEIAVEIARGRVTTRGKSAARTIRRQSLALARTAVRDMNRQVREQTFDRNFEDLERFNIEWTWVAVLDSRTCAFCASLDNAVRQRREQFPRTPAHIECRCEVLPFDPAAPELKIRQGIEINNEKFVGPGSYKTKTKVKGEKFYRRSFTVTPTEGERSSYADYLAKLPRTRRDTPTDAIRITQAEFFGGGKAGAARGATFRRLIRDGDTPQLALKKLVINDPARIQNLSEADVPRTRFVPVVNLREISAQ